ncbi:MAG TPA: ATP-binding protein, partial [Nitrospirota bacterium]|nr:ATP-binding protein [Nitrospirota bacterium]
SFLVSANFIGMFASYQMELSIRKDYLQRRLIRGFEEKKRLLEKEKILKDLHDGVGGIATSIALLAETARSESSIMEVRKTLDSIFELSRESLTEIRGYIQSLDVKELDWESLIADLRHLGNNLLEARGIRFSLTASYGDAQGRPDTLLYINLFRIYKEAITNIIKHANASVVSVIMDIAPERLLLTVEDDGVGLQQERAGGRGMASMRDRARDLGGLLTVQTGRGTKIVVDVPLPVKYRPTGMEIPSQP